MKYRQLILLSVLMTTIGACLAQSTVIDDFKPASSNQPNKQYPQVNSERRVKAGITAPQAQKVQLDIGGKRYDLTKDEKGLWTVSYTHLRAHETVLDLVCRLLLEKKNKTQTQIIMIIYANSESTRVSYTKQSSNS